ncbi:MAG: heavy metal translocating P-type ATPase, partial [Acidimicrobiia bacterium]|nr:heavy metal translocating P-type ATPase [Acidimicrobiia bacterium]
FVFSIVTLVWDLGEDFFWELVTLIDIMLLGHWLEMRSVRQASGALGALAKLMPDTAEVVDDAGGVHEVTVAEVRQGDVVLVRPGASVPADARVVDGTSEFDESMITGESKPIDKEVGDTLIGGTVNAGSGAVRASVAAVGDDTTLAGIMRLVADAEASKSPTQLLADKAAAFLFYIALIAAAVTAIAWTLYFGDLDQRTVARVVTVLVIACPHALGLAIPLVVAITTETAAKHGTLIRRREAIDTAHNLQKLGIDKTGTLTEGRIGVVDVAAVEGHSTADVVMLAAAAERDSEHPLARAIRTAADDRGLEPPDAADFTVHKGRGVTARVDGREVQVGGPRLVEGLDTPVPDTLARFSDDAGDEGHSVVYVIVDGVFVGSIALDDVIRPESAEAVRVLTERGVEVVMITGDSRDVATAVADRLGIATFHAEVLPEDKDALVTSMKADGSMVGMVGDGVNDAPALARADIGIAIGGGTDVAIESADLVLVKSNPLDIVRIIELSRASYRKQKQNIWWGAGYNIVMIPLAAGVLAPWGVVVPPSVGALLMSISTIVVAVNAQLLRTTDLTEGIDSDRIATEHSDDDHRG